MNLSFQKRRTITTHSVLWLQDGDSSELLSIPSDTGRAVMAWTYELKS